MIASLRQYLDESRLVGDIDRAFADMLVRRSDAPADRQDALYVLAAATLNAVRQSHSCLDIAAWCTEVIDYAQARMALYDESALRASETAPLPPTPEVLASWFTAWRQALPELACDALLWLDEAGNMPADATSPLCLWHAPDGRTLAYLNRYASYEATIASEITQRMNAAQPEESTDDDALKDAIHRSNRNFAALPFEECFQQQAVFHTLKSRFSIITGGPGTGKTTVLAVILAQLLKDNPKLSISLCAPTGKAAARMKEAIENAVSNTLTDAIGDDIKQTMLKLKTLTVHKLAGIARNTDYPLHNRENLIDSDVIAVDECSMMSLQLFSQLLCAIPPQARVILLGDENQLASVDAGNVLAELCHSPVLSERPTGARIINRLVKNYRSKANPELCAYAANLVTEGMTADGMSNSVEGLYSGAAPLFSALEPDASNAKNSDDQLKDAIREFLAQAGVTSRTSFRTYAEAAVFLRKVKLLGAVREGRYGIKNLNRIVREILNRNDEYADGVPVMVTQNDAVTGLSNGDVGICFKGKVYFSERDDTTDGALVFEVAQLPPHEIAFAMTIHKSQGSDYENVFMVLADKDNPVLCRELVYTGITRTKRRFRMLAPRGILDAVQLRRTVRWTGLGCRLHN